MESLLSAGALILIDPIVHFSPTKYENIKNGIRFTFPTLALGLIAAKHFEWIALSSPLLVPPLAIAATALLTFNIARIALNIFSYLSKLEKDHLDLKTHFKNTLKAQMTINDTLLKELDSIKESLNPDSSFFFQEVNQSRTTMNNSIRNLETSVSN